MAKTTESVIPPGLDLFETAAADTFQDFAQTPIPGLFFGLFTSRFKGKIYFKGRPIAPPVLGTADTLVLRKKPAVLPGPVAIPIELVVLSIESREPVRVRRLWWTEEWDVCVGLSCLKPSDGEMTITARGKSAEGGTFDSVLCVFPRFTFTRRRDGKVRTIDGVGPITLTAKDIPWVKTTPPGLDPPPAFPASSPGFLAGVNENGGRMIGLDAAQTARHAVMLAKPYSPFA